MAKRTAALGLQHRSAYMQGRQAVTSPPTAKKGWPEKVSFYIAQEFTADLMDRVRDCVDFLSGPPPQGTRLTLNRFVAEAFDAHLLALQRAHHKGKPFPRRAGPLKRGSRPKG